MSDQPTGSDRSGPSYDVYDAPAYGDVAPDGTPPTQVTPATQLTPPMAAPDGGAYADPYAAPAHPAAPQQQWGVYSGATPYQVPGRYVANPNAPTHPTATTAMVLGIISLASALLTPFVLFTVVGVACAPFAIWLGVKARREINANPQAWNGHGAATAGLVTGIIGLVIGLLILLAIVAFFVLIASIFAGF